MSPRAAQPGFARWLPWGDTASLLAFTVLGLRFHKIALTPYEILQTAAPLIAAWVVVARFLRTYTRPGPWPFLATWMLSVTIGLAVRQVWLARPFGRSFFVFLAVGGTLTLAFLVLWRALAAALRLVRPA
ncbi:MAG: DUF3054 domain-containing protein [Armatimonadota bacterium]|nr:DUF3054 domain-containing protein [Armatimonadota bacterium]